MFNAILRAGEMIIAASLINPGAFSYLIPGLSLFSRRRPELLVARPSEGRWTEDRRDERGPEDQADRRIRHGGRGAARPRTAPI